jgi:spore germination protein YaaH
MWGKALSKVLPLPFWSSLVTAFVFLAVIAGALYYSKQLDQPVNLFKALLVSPINSVATPRHEVIGFLPSWNAAKEVKFDTSKLTQIIYFGFGVNSRGEIIQFGDDGSETLEWVHFKSPYFKKIREDAKKTDTKILVAIKNFDNKNIDDLISNPNTSEKFITQLIKLVKDNKLDGVNIDFEYFTDSNFPTFKHLNTFFTKLSQRLKAENPNYIISADFNASAVASDPAYDMVKLGEVIDQIILMGYDYSTTASSQATPVAPLFSADGEASIDKSISSLKGRVHFDKVILAIPFYGYEWQTINNKFRSQTVPETGALATYDRVTQLINSRNDIEINWDNKSQTPWITYYQSGAFKQIYFENEQSIAKKLDYIKKSNLAGVGIWAIGYEGENQNFWDLIKKFK